MPSFVHIADERDAAAIQRSGLKVPRARLRSARSDGPVGVFALPVVANFLLSHQWVRELKRRGHRTAVGVYFKVSAQEVVWAGLYNQPKQQMTAGQATSALLNQKGDTMISDREFAKRCTDLVFEYSAKLDQTVAEAQALLSAEEFRNYRRAVGAVMAEGLVQILNPVFRQHPDLQPKGLD